jgi:glycosyltransferase involved in cell wall biosynthesis
MEKMINSLRIKDSLFKHCIDDISNIRIIIPAFNEEKNLKPLLMKLKDLGYNDILVIDGNSIDRTIEVAKNNGSKIVIQKGKGKGDAIRQILNSSNIDVDALVFMDADCSMDPEEIPIFIRGLKSGADIVKGSRFLRGGFTHDMSLFRRIGNELFVSLVNLFFSTKYSDLCYGFMGFNRRAVESLSQILKSKNFEIETEIIIKAKKLGLKVLEVPSTEFKRKNGESNLCAFKDGLRIFQTIFDEVIPNNNI